MFENRLSLYDQAIAMCEDFTRKGKSMPYTSVNGHMFSQLNKDGQLGIRLSKENREAFGQEYPVEPFLSYKSVMKDYVLIPEPMWEDLGKIAALLKQGHQYALSLPPK